MARLVKRCQSRPRVDKDMNEPTNLTAAPLFRRTAAYQDGERTMKVSLARIRVASCLLFLATVAFAGPRSVEAALLNMKVLWTQSCGDGEDCSAAQQNTCESDCEDWCDNNPQQCGELGVGGVCEAFGDPCFADCVCYYNPPPAPAE